MTEVAVIGDGLAGHLIVERLISEGVDVVWFGGGEPTVPPVALLHRHVGRSFEVEPPERDAWLAASAWARALAPEAARSLTMYRPTSPDSRLSRTFDQLELDHVFEVDCGEVPFLAETERVFRYDDAWSIDVGAVLRERPAGRLGTASSIVRSSTGLIVRGAEEVEVEHVVVAAGLGACEFFEKMPLKPRPGELALIPRPAGVPYDVAVSRNGHFGPTPDGQYLCVGATYRDPDAGPRDDEAAGAACVSGIGRSVPALLEPAVTAAWYGVRAVVHPDRRPLAGQTDVPGLWLATGLASKGMLWGARVRDVVVDGILRASDAPEAVDPRRFSSMRARV